MLDLFVSASLVLTLSLSLIFQGGSFFWLFNIFFVCFVVFLFLALPFHHRKLSDVSPKLHRNARKTCRATLYAPSFNILGRLIPWSTFDVLTNGERARQRPQSPRSGFDCWSRSLQLLYHEQQPSSTGTIR